MWEILCFSKIDCMLCRATYRSPLAPFLAAISETTSLHHDTDAVRKIHDELIALSLSL